MYQLVMNEIDTVQKVKMLLDLLSSLESKQTKETTQLQGLFFSFFFKEKRMTQKLEPRTSSVEEGTMGNNLKAVGLSLNQRTVNMCLIRFQNCCGRVTSVALCVFPFWTGVSITFISLHLTQHYVYIGYLERTSVWGIISCLFSP